MKRIETLLEELTPIFENKPQQISEHKDVINEKVLSFIRDNIKENKEQIAELIKIAPFALFYIHFEKDSDDDNTEFVLFFNSLLEAEENALSISKNSIYHNFIFKNYNEKWFEEHKSFLNKEILLLFKDKMNYYNRNLIIESYKLFAENYDSKKEFFIDLHSILKVKYGKETVISIPSQIVDFCKDEITEDVYHLFKDDILGKRVHYVTESTYELNEVYDDFMLEEDIVEYYEKNKVKDNIYSLRTFLNRFGAKLSEERLTEYCDVFISKDFKNNDRSSGYNYFNNCDSFLKDFMADKVFSISPWSYIYFTDSMKLEFLEKGKINFDEYKGLYRAHPKPETVANEVWIELLKESEIHLRHTPEFLFKGKRALSEDDWFDILSATPETKNHHFKNLVKDHMYVLTNNLLNRLVELKGHSIQNKGFLRDYIYMVERQNKEKNYLTEALEIALSGNSKKTSKAISKLAHINIATKSNIELVLNAFKEGVKNEQS